MIWLVGILRPRWGTWGSVLLGAFGVLMVASAVFSHGPWLPGVPYDEVEDRLHSFAATAMGFAFAAGVVAVGLRRVGPRLVDRVFDLFVVGVSVVIPLAMSVATDYTGLLQRAMFLIAYLWYCTETLRSDDARCSVRCDPGHARSDAAPGSPG